MASASVSDVATTLGRPINTDEEISQVNDWIADAEVIISARLGDLSTLDSQILRMVVKESVARRVRNPEGKQNERIDDYSYGLTADAAKASLFITDEEWALLSPDGSTTGAFMPLVNPQPWVGWPRMCEPWRRPGEEWS